MADDNDNEPTFTQEQVNSIVTREVRKAAAKVAPPDDYDEVKAKAAKFDELDGQTKNAAEAATRRADAAERKAADAEAKALRYEVAADIVAELVKAGKAPPALGNIAKRLSGNTHEELDDDAKEVIDLLGGTTPAAGKPGDDDDDRRKAPPSTRPTPTLRGGAAPEEEPESDDPAALAALVPRG